MNKNKRAFALAVHGCAIASLANITYGDFRLVIWEKLVFFTCMNWCAYQFAKALLWERT